MTTIQELAQTSRVSRLAANYTAMTPVMRLAKARFSPLRELVERYSINHSEHGMWEAWFSADKKQWILIATNPTTRSGVPKMKIFTVEGKMSYRMVTKGHGLERRLMADIEKSLDAHVAKYDFDSDPHIHPSLRKASAVIVGDIFVASWGHEQTNVDFYQVVKTTPKMIAIRPIDKKTGTKKTDFTRTVVPIANKFTGSAIRKKLDEYRGTPMVRLNSYSFAYKWDGKEKNETSYG